MNKIQRASLSAEAVDSPDRAGHSAVKREEHKMTDGDEEAIRARLVRVLEEGDQYGYLNGQVSRKEHR